MLVFNDGVALDTNGVAQSVTWLDSLNNALVLPTSSAIYDYEWIAGSNCLVARKSQTECVPSLKNPSRPLRT